VWIQSFFDYGDVLIQPAAKEVPTEIGGLSVCQASRLLVAKLVSELIDKEEIEQRKEQQSK